MQVADQFHRQDQAMSEGQHPATPDSTTDGVTDGMTDRNSPPARVGRPPMPRWVKVLLIIVLVLAAALLISKALGLEHGSGMHSALPDGTLLNGTLLNGALMDRASAAAAETSSGHTF